MKSILDSDFEYTPAAKTDLKKTFARVRKEIAAQQVVPLTPEPVSSSLVAEPRHQSSDRAGSAIATGKGAAPIQLRRKR